MGLVKSSVARKAAFAHIERARPTMVNRHGAFGWQGYIIPAPYVRDVLLKHGPTLNNESPAVQHDIGWQTVLATRIARILGTKDTAPFRRIYGLLADEANIVLAQWADACCLSLGLRLDHDIELPVLPGNSQTARELIIERAAFAGDSLTPKQLNALTKKLIRLARLIVHYPHHTERLLDLAPYDCLRPYRREDVCPSA